MIEKVQNFITDSFTVDGKASPTIKHSIRVLHWIKVLRPDADEALQIAALAHDVQRAFRVNHSYKHLEKSEKGFRDDAFLDRHQSDGAEIIFDFIVKNGGDQKLAERVKMLVSKHEVGGNADQNLLKDADSLSFFENNIDHFLNDIIQQYNKTMVREKFDWMYNRIDSPKAKEIAKPWYDGAIRRLSSLN